MTGGFNTNVRGIQIDVTKTLNKFLNQNKKAYTREQFEDYLTKINLDDTFGNGKKYYHGQSEPINEAFVVSFDFDEGDDQEAFGILATGLWEYQYWVIQQWCKENLEEQTTFTNPKYLDKTIKNNLKKLWNDKLILKGKFAIYSIRCEWSHRFFLK